MAGSQPAPATEAAARHAGAFATTHWSIVLAARDADSPESRIALETLCQSYWGPIYAFLRRSGYNAADAHDLVQGFFERFFEKNHLARLRHCDGKFRSFLLTFLKRFLSDERAKSQAQKRGGGRPLISLEACAAEEASMATIQDIGPDLAFDRRWAITLLERARTRLRQECETGEKRVWFETWQQLQESEDSTLSFARAAAELGIPASTLRSHAYRLRQRYRQLLREEIGRTVAGPAEVDEEIAYLLEVVSR